MSMWLHIEGILSETSNLWFDMGIYLVFGFAVAGILSRVLKREAIARHLGNDSLGSVAKASLFGVPLPLCSCGVVPVALSLFRRGASRSATASFLISTPETGVDSIVVTWAFLGPVFAVLRPVAAFLNGCVGGLLVMWFGEKGRDRGPEPQTSPADSSAPARISLVEHARKAAHYGFVEFPAEIVRWLVVGIVLAGAISYLMPADILERYMGRGFLSMAVAALTGVPLYICATASVPLVAVLMAKGLGAGAALVFLMVGPATNAASLVLVARTIGKRSAALYLTSIVGCAFAFGAVLDLYVAGHTLALPILSAQHRHAQGMEGWVRLAGAAGLALIVVVGLWRSFRLDRIVLGRAASADTSVAEERETVDLRVEGMTCPNCARHVREALEGVEGVVSAGVSLHAGKATVSGRSLDRGLLVRAVEVAGYRAEELKRQ